MYVWARHDLAVAMGSVGFCLAVAQATGVALAPGSAFGRAGEGMVRFALVQPPPLLEEAARRVAVWAAEKAAEMSAEAEKAAEKAALRN